LAKRLTGEIEKVHLGCEAGGRGPVPTCSLCHRYNRNPTADKMSEKIDLKSRARKNCRVLPPPRNAGQRMGRLIGLCICLLVAVSVRHASATTPQDIAPLTNEDLIRLKKAGISDDVIILTINSGATKFSTEPADLAALKNAGVSDAVITAMLKPVVPTKASSGSSVGDVPADLSRAALVLPFESTVTGADAVGLPDATRTAVVHIMKDNRMFTALLSPEEAVGKKTLVVISAELVDFARGNVATRIVIGLGTGRAHAGFNFVVKDSANGKVLWKKTIKETASFWSNSASSSAQRLELPEKVAKSFVEELQKAKLTVLAQ
jgi:hypothetical protein